MAQQSILGRIGQLARANIHALLDAAEDPDKMRDQMVRDYTANIAEAEAEDAVAQTIGNLRLLERGDTAWMDQHLADDVVWHVGGNSKWAGPTRASRRCWSTSAVRPRPRAGRRRWRSTTSWATTSTWRFTQLFHIRDGKATQVWGMAENDAAVDPFLDGLPG